MSKPANPPDGRPDGDPVRPDLAAKVGEAPTNPGALDLRLVDQNRPGGSAGAPEKTKDELDRLALYLQGPTAYCA